MLVETMHFCLPAKWLSKPNCSACGGANKAKHSVKPRRNSLSYFETRELSIAFIQNSLNLGEVSDK
ncbi:hypothetical protein ACT3CE_00570 [Marinifilum sp. RC60d5]|uniref:hypothetical protein n=1 Tax=Marinifilum sp. RC60d5 TaxID=3458414 RepID=UPI0040375393